MIEDVMGFSPADRTLLVRIQVEVEHLVNDLKANDQRIHALENDHVSREEFRDARRMIDELSVWRWKVLGAATALGTVSSYAFRALFK